MNKIILMGRITHDLELKQSQSGTSYMSFQLAVDRYMGQGKEKQSDFIRCTAFGQTADNIHRYFGKGKLILLEGSLRADGSKYTDRSGVEHQSMPCVWIERFDFTGEKSNNGNGGYNNGGYSNNGNNGYNNAPNNYNSQSVPPPNNQSIPPIGSSDDYEDFYNSSNENLPF